MSVNGSFRVMSLEKRDRKSHYTGTRMSAYYANATTHLTLTTYFTRIPRFSRTSLVSSTPGGKLFRERERERSKFRRSLQYYMVEEAKQVSSCLICPSTARPFLS